VTLVLALVMAFVNLGLIANAPNWLRQIPEFLEYDAARIESGQLWRLLTGNLVHWSIEHALLDVGAFVAVGLMYERRLRAIYPALLLTSGIAVSLALYGFQPEMNFYRGFSGINSAQFAAVVAIEIAAACRDPKRWWWVAPAAGIFAIKILSECVTGQLFFDTASLGEIGQPVPLAHGMGAACGVATVLASGVFRDRHARLPDSGAQVCQN
jgi:rhomboid family GlyGly-CTERM serine protease